MSKKFKTGILIALLLVPVLFYLFLYFSGQNFYQLPYYGPRLGLDAEGDTLYYNACSVENPADGKVKAAVVIPGLNDKTNLTLSGLEKLANAYSDTPAYLEFVVYVSEDAQSNFMTRLPEYRSLAKHAGERLVIDTLTEVHTKRLLLSKDVNSAGADLVLLDKDGYIRSMAISSEMTSVDEFMKDINVLVQEYEFREKEQ